MKIADDGAMAAEANYVDEVDRRWSDLITTSTVNELPVLRQFICRFTETRVRSELAQRRRSMPRSSLFVPRDSARLKVPTYRGVRSTNPDVGRSLGNGRIERILKSVIIQTISEKLFPVLGRRSTWEADRKDANQSAGLSFADVTPAPDVLDSRSSSSDDCASGGTLAVSEDVDGGRGPPGRKTRPKRGHYRKYNRQLLLDAVRAVQKGDMSVHRAGSYYGVPHSTLEYKVKERHLLRQRKTESTGSATGGGLTSSRRRGGHADDSGRHPVRSIRDRAAPEMEKLRVESSEGYLAGLQGGSGPWPYSIADAATDDPIPPWQRLFHPDQPGLSPAPSAALRLPPPPPLLPFDLGRTLPVGFGWPPPPSLLAGMFPLRGDGADPHRLPMLGSGAHPFSMSASDLLKTFQRKAAASGGGSDVNEIADSRLVSLFPVLSGSPYGVAGREDGGSPS